MDLELIAVTAEDRLVLANLMQLYLHDFSELEATELTELSAHGTFDYPWLDSYFTSPTREAYLIRLGGRLAGFALARCDIKGDEGAWNLSEFFVARGHRRRGVAAAAARLLFQRHPGTWTLSYLHHNGPAARLWPALAAAVSSGAVHQVEQHPPAVSAAKSRLRFEVPADSAA
jgi:predicted acetyltransferase